MRIKKKYFVWSGLIIVMAIIAFFGFSSLMNRAIKVDMGIVERGRISEYIEESAHVKLETEIDVFAPQGGRIVSVLYEVGDTINEGDLLIKLDDKEYIYQIKSLELQKQGIAAKKKEASKELSEAELGKLEAEEKSARIALDEAKRIAESNLSLFNAGAISKSLYESSMAALAIAEANYEVVKSIAEIAIEASGKGITGLQKDIYDIQVKEIQNQIDLLEKKQSELSIKAPSAGIILERDAEIGNVLLAGKRIFQIGSIDDIFLESDILADEASRVYDGAQVMIENKDLGIYGLKGIVRKIYPKAFNKISQLGVEQKRVKIEIDFLDMMPDLKPGMDMDIKVITSIKDDIVIIDEKAIFEYFGHDYVFINDKGIAKMREIEKGIEEDGRVEILKGLAEGEYIVISPGEKMTEGKRIK